MSAERRLEQLSLELPPPFTPTGVFRPLVAVRGLIYVAGHGPLLPSGRMMTGRIGPELDVAAGYLAARQTGLSILSTLRDGLGSLDRIRRLVKAFVMLNCEPGFTEHPQVADGFSELFADVFGKEKGVGVRCAVGMSSLPGGIPVEIEIVVETHAASKIAPS